VSDRMTEERLLAWHFLREDGCLNHPPYTKVEVGQTLMTDGEPIHVFYASVRAIDALAYASGPIVCRVELRGVIVADDDKAVANQRTVLAMADASTVLHEFACDGAEAALREHGVTDKRSWAAIETKRKWLKGEATSEELKEAREAAEAAAEAAARGARTARTARKEAGQSRWAEEVAEEAARWASWAAGEEAAEETARWAGVLVPAWLAGRVVERNIDLEKRLRQLLALEEVDCE
jgi:hypothetical protein